MAGEPARMCPTVAVLPDGWQEKRLGSFCTKIGTGATPRGGSEVYLNSRVSHALVRSQHVFDRHFDLAGLAFISSVHAKELRNAELQSGDVLLNITGDGVTFGRSCIVPDGVLPACVNQHVAIIRPDLDICHPGYLLSVLTHPAAKDYIESFNSGGSRRAITKGHIESFEIPLPPLPTQRAIAHVLGTLDDLIELNRETNEILEEMARALFKSWFVDFDPVRRNKEEGRRMKVENADPSSFIPHPSSFDHLFPDHFQDSELGQIPMGWAVGKVSDFVSLGRVAVNPGNHPSEAFDHYSLPAFDDGRSPKTESGNTIMSNKFHVEPDAVLLSKLNPHIPRVWFPDLNTERRSVCSTEFMVARAVSGATREYLYSLFTNPSFATIYGTLVSGTTGSHQRISPDSFLAMQLAAPPVPLIAAFTDLVKPIFDTIHSNLRESRDLATLRDTLLPKLLSGEVDVSSLQSRMEIAP